MRPGPAPKHPSQRVRRGSANTARRGLPAGGYTGPIPQWPLDENPVTEAEVKRWRELWRTPQAEAWAGCSFETGLAVMVQLEIRCQRPRASGQHFAELRHARSEFGLTLDSMAKLGLDIQDETPDEGTGTARVRRLRAIDPDVSA
jgi:hypothetical protein